MTGCNLVAQLNARWRVVVSRDGAQWILQRLHENDDWRARSRCRARPSLERVVKLFAGEVDPAAQAILAALPGHIDWSQADNKRPFNVTPSHHEAPAK
ncbi:hypothetical protein A1D31_11820 [Bradyrhizobium liaoningense]|nr:hypothetical protein A1D31_11820 [Bradyrhizobium liaoningense]